MMLKQRLEDLFFSVEPVLTALLYPICLLKERWSRQPGVPILMYHQVGCAPEGARFCTDAVSSDRFEQQIETILAAGYRVIPLMTLVDHLRDGSPAALKRAVVLTFDDGLRDQLANAQAILRRHRLSATFFLVAGYVGKDALLPHLSLDEASHGPGCGWRTLSWNEAEQLLRDGASIGCHSLSHRSLGVVAASETDREVRLSKEILEQGLNRPVETFAYPFGSQAYGDCDQSVQDALRRAGYRAACTTVVGTNRRGTDLFALRRIPIDERDGPFRMRCKLSGAYDWVGILKGLWQRLVAREDRVDTAGVLAAECQGGAR